MKIVSALIVFIFPLFLNAQELNAKVTMNYEQLPTAAREILEGFDKVVENYLNTNRFTETEWEGAPIDCNFTIFFNGTSELVNFAAQLIVNSSRPIYNSNTSSLMLNIRDETWKFTYEKNQGLYFNQSDFNSLTSLLDYYAYVIIGFDADSYSPMGGDQYFQKAVDIAVYGSNSKYKDGWELSSASYNRRGLVEDLRSAKFGKLREDIFEYHYDGIDLWSDPSQRPAAKEKIAKLVKDLGDMGGKIDPRSVFLKVFFNAKSSEIIDYLKDYPEKNIWEILKKVDPAHSGKYDEILYGD